jgi:endonuclease/exonuclease/phosphatase family metal-dependent hydrolase
MFAISVACGADGSADIPVPAVVASPPAPASAVATDPLPEPTEFKVAFVNLMSPVPTDSTDPLPAETYDQRLELMIHELTVLRPDVIAFSEATITKAHGSSVARLAKELKMEFQYVRANPWFPGQTQQQNDELVKQIGFEEGELILSRYPIVRYKKGWLNPRTSETEGRAVLHVVVKGPDALGEVDIYVTHLTGGGERVKLAQARALLNFVGTTRGGGPTVILGDFGEFPGSTTTNTLVEWGLYDVVAALPSDVPELTCCREGIAGDQPPVTNRTDFIFAERWKASAVGVFGDVAGQRLDGSPLWASDHNGIYAVFPIINKPVP